MGRWLYSLDASPNTSRVMSKTQDHHCPKCGLLAPGIRNAPKDLACKCNTSSRLHETISDLESNVQAGAHIASAWLNGEDPKGHVLNLAARLLALKIK